MRVLAAILGLTLAAVCGVPHAGAADTIFPFAGTGASGSTGDGQQAIAATFTDPRALAVMADGSLLIGDDGAARVRKVAPDGTITTIIGTGVNGSTGDGGLASAAPVNRPLGLAVAPEDKAIYVGEYGGYRVRRIDPDGTVTRVVGTGVSTFSGEGAAGSVGIGRAYGIAVNAAGDLFIAGSTARRIYRVVAGSNQVIDATDQLELLAGTGTNGSSGDGGAAVSAQFVTPTSVVPLSDGSLAIADFDGYHVRRVAPNGTISTIGGTGAACAAGGGLCGEGGLATLAPITPLYITSRGDGSVLFGTNNKVRRIGADGTISTIAGLGTGCSTVGAACGDFGPAPLANLAGAYGIVASPDGSRLYVLANNRVRVVIADPLNTGPAGPAGPTGTQGPQGTAGTPGAPGAAGPDGAPGAAGADGQPGADGPPGVDGQPGADGAPGADGPVGPPGSRGRDGAAGATGADGALGTLTPLLATLPASRISKSRRSAVRLSVFVTGPADLELKLTRGARVRQFKGKVRGVGRTTVSFGRLPQGSYRLVLTARRGTAVFVDRCTLIVR